MEKATPSPPEPLPLPSRKTRPSLSEEIVADVERMARDHERLKAKMRLPGDRW